MLHRSELWDELGTPGRSGAHSSAEVRESYGVTVSLQTDRQTAVGH